MHQVFEILSEQPVLFLFILIGIGMAFGHVKIKGISLGAAAVLFFAIALAAWAQSYGIELRVTPQLGTLGLTLFTFAIGINSGAGLFVLFAASVFPSALWLPPLAAFAGALATALIIFGISLGANTSRLTVVLAGIAITSVFGAGMNTILIVNPDAYIGSSAFLVGGLSGVLMDDLAWPAAYIVGGLAVALLAAGKLNIMALGDDTAHALGMNVGATRLAMLGLAAELAGAAVSFAGLLGFVGLIIPHLVRFFVGHDNRLVLPLSAVSGAVFVVVCDLLARVLFAPYEVPVGILMAFLGGPFFIYLILKNRRGSLD